MSLFRIVLNPEEILFKRKTDPGYPPLDLSRDPSPPKGPRLKAEKGSSFPEEFIKGHVTRHSSVESAGLSGMSEITL